MRLGHIFDLDGTLLNSEYVWQNVDREFFAKRGLVMPEDYGEKTCTMGFIDGARYTIERFSLKETPESLVEEWKALAQREYAENVALFPYVREYLEDLRAMGQPMGVATACHRELYLPALVHNGIDKYFDCLIDADMVKFGKNGPDIYLMAAEKLGLPPEGIMVYEDILPGIKVAKSAGFKVTAVLSGFSQGQREEIIRTADYYIIPDSCPAKLIPAGQSRDQ